MKTFLLFWLCALLPVATQAESEAGWSADFDQALHAAGASGHPLLLDFSATWCGPCQAMARTTLKDQDVTQKLGSFQKVKVDIDANAPLAERFGIHAVPTFVVVGGDGEEITRTTGAMDAANFGAWLNSVLSTAAFSAARREEFKKEQTAVAAGLKQTDPNALDAAVQTLFDYSLRKEKYYRDFAVTNLKAAARTHPALLLGALGHEKLAVRILAANILREQLGAAFDFDPWAGGASRRAMIDKLKARLGQAGN